jgi:hypothetical protein
MSGARAGSFATLQLHHPARHDPIPAQPLGVASDGAGGSLVYVACFAEGTKIATADGETVVEAIAEGDCVTTVSGNHRAVRWVGYRTIECRRHPCPWDVRPVRIKAGAFADGVPTRDVLLSPDHAMFVAGCLIPVRYLINGRTIVQERVARVTYYHVELERHDLLLASGLPCESYLDTGNRGAFTNGGGALQLHPDFAQTAWAVRSAAPPALSGPVLVAARSSLLTRAAELGNRLTDAPGVRIIADGRDVAFEHEDGQFLARLPSGCTVVRLRSRRWVPAHVRAAESDFRRLGIAVRDLRFDGVAADLSDPRLSSGWHDPEGDWRWTTGDGGVSVAGVRRLAFRIAMAGSYWTRAGRSPPAAARGIQGARNRRQDRGGSGRMRTSGRGQATGQSSKPGIGLRVA